MTTREYFHAMYVKGYRFVHNPDGRPTPNLYKTDDGFIAAVLASCVGYAAEIAEDGKLTRLTNATFGL